MSQPKKLTEKFIFDLDFQYEILRYTLKDKHGYKALYLYKHESFDLDEQKIIARAIHRYFKRTGRTPKSAAILNEELNGLFKTRDYAQGLKEKDRREIKARVKKLFAGVLKEPEEILAKIRNFASYVNFKQALEEVNINDYSSYATYVKKFQNALSIGVKINEHRGLFMVGAASSRFIGRRNNPDIIIPTRIRQIDRLTNAGGYAKGSVIVVVDKPKKGKTEFLCNVARKFIGNVSMKNTGNKKVIYFDLENGEQNISCRVDQAVALATKQEILNGIHDAKLKKIYRKFSRLGGELYIVRMPAYSTIHDFQKIIDDQLAEFGIRYEVAIIDYMGLMGAISGKKEDFDRISDAYLDVKNWAEKNELDMVFTGHHIKREAYSRRASKYRSDDLAKCIDIERHVDAIFGIQQNDLEEKANILRLEVIVQRDGAPHGRALFHNKIQYQRLTEFSKEDLRDYEETIGKYFESDSPEPRDKKPKTKSTLE